MADISSIPTSTSTSPATSPEHTRDFLKTVKLPSDWMLNERELCDLEMLLSGAFAPLRGYLTQADYYSVLDKMRLTTGEVWAMPIVLAIPKSSTTPNVHWMEGSASQADGDEADTMRRRNGLPVVQLRDRVGSLIADLAVSDVYEPDLLLEQQKVLGTTDTNHPYVAYLNANHKDCYYVGGEVIAKEPIQHFDFLQYRQSPEAVREAIKRNGWETVIGFQTRNPMHCSHYELTRQAMKEVEAADKKDARLLLTPVVGPTQPGDIEYHIRVRCYKMLLSHYPPNSVEMVLLPIAMRMAGPREAVWHAIIRRNYGCTHFIVGRDHAGPSTKRQDGQPFYGEYDAHKLLESVQEELGIKPVFGKAMVYVGQEHGGYVQANATPTGAVPKTISGTELRRRLQNREPIPEWFSFADVVSELHRFYLPLHQRGLCIYFTGLPCSGKSTLANAVQAALLENANEERRITVFDADIIRTHLSKGLGFSKEDRSSNVRRIGFVASEVVKHNGICLVANIAPYKEDREFNRDIITKESGGYMEVYVATPLEVCERRDVKQLYKKARQGIIKQFTGVSDPYQAPEAAELTVDSSDDIHGKVGIVMTYLRENHLIL